MDRLHLQTKSQYQLGISIGFIAAITMIGYELARSASYTLFKFEYGTDKLPLVMAFIPIAAIASIYIYDLFLNRWGPRRTLILSTLFSAFTFFICYLGLLYKIKLASAVLFVFREIYIVILVEQYWSYINSGLEKDIAKKINGPLIGISSLGSIAGGFISGQLAEPLGTMNIILIPMALCLPAAYFSHKVYKIFGEPQPKKTQLNFSKTTGLKALLNSKHLRYLFFIIIFTQILATTLDLAFQNRIQIHMPQMDQQTSYLGYFFASLNGIALFFQFILTPVLLRHMNPMLVFILIPLVNFVFCGWALLDSSLYSIGASLLLFKAMDYSLFRATKETFYIPLNFDVRYRTKEIIDVFGYRTSKGLTSLSISLLQNFTRFTDSLFIGVAFSAVLIWTFLAVSFKKTENDITHEN